AIDWGPGRPSTREPASMSARSRVRRPAINLSLCSGTDPLWSVIMTNSRFLFTLASAAVLASGCATSTASSNSASRYVITDAELVNAREESAYDALQQLRPTFLRSRDPQTPTHQNPTPIAVFVNGGRTEGI